MINLREAGKFFYLLAKLPDATLAFFQNDRKLYNPNDSLDMWITEKLSTVLSIF